MEDAVDQEQTQASIPYHIVSQLSADRTGLLYRAIRDDNGEDVDLLVLKNVEDPHVREMRKRISIASQMQHPAAARVIEAHQEEDHQSFLLEPLADLSLKQIASDRAGQGNRDLLDYSLQMASVIVAGHRMGLTHGQITPDTARIRPDGSLQFDFVRLEVHDASDRNLDWQFLAPEAHSANNRDAMADVFSLASLVVWVFSGPEGQPVPKLDDFRGKIEQSVAASAMKAAEIDEFCDTVKQGLADDPSDRITAHDLWIQLSHFASAWDKGDQTVSAPVMSPDELEMTYDSGTATDSRSSVAEAPVEGTQIGRFVVREKLGEGGMGAVFRAEDLSDGSTVALKVLSQRVVKQPAALRRFYKEGRLLGEIKSPYVTNLLEMNQDGGLHYIVMEYVAGVDLRSMTRKRGPIDQTVALSIIADAARGLVSAHQREIIHRDIKPGNNPSGFYEAPAGSPLDFTTLSREGLKQFRVKLSDFGLAREMVQSESMEMTQIGTVVGTPTYMSPEQFSNQDGVCPATDVYALGITLYEMLAGRPPFVSPDLMKLINMHCREEPAPLHPFNPDVSDATCEIVQRAIAKSVEDRYADASQFLRDVERVLRGEATDISVHPELPEHQPGEIFEEVFAWTLKSSAAELWPYVSNTERINSAVGVPSVEYQTARDERGRLRKYGVFKLAGLKIGWEEHPFEWVEGQRLGILRDFSQGPFVWFLSIVELIPIPGGGTTLRHSVRIKPRGLLGRLVAKMEVSIKGKRNLERVYHRIDDAISGQLGSGPTIDPFTDPKKLSSARRERLETRLDRLARRGIDPDIVDALARFLRDAPSQELARIRPIPLAKNFGIDENRWVDACLTAVTEGLLELHWDILCPTCRISSEVVDTLQQIEDHARCEVCDIDFDVDLSNSVEMIFRADPEIRSADLGTYCIGGPEHSPHVVFQIRLAAGKRIELAPLLSEGEYVLRSAQLSHNVRIRALIGKGTTATELVLSPDFDPNLVALVRAGRNVLTITNEHDNEVVIRLERTIPMTEVMTAAQATALPVFRELFPGESPQTGRLLKIAMVTLLSIDLADTETLFFKRGDGVTYSCMQSFQTLVQSVAKQHGGNLVRVLGTELQFVFETPVDALEAVMEAARQLEAETELDVRFCAALHRGTALATSSDGRLDYFGGTVLVVQRLLRLAEAGELIMTENAASDPMMVSQIQHLRLRTEVCDFSPFGPFGSRCQRLRID